LFKRLLPRDLDLRDRAGIENGEADLVVEVAGQDDLLVDDGNRAIEDNGAGRLRLLDRECWRRGKQQRENEQFCRCAPPKINRRSFDSARRKITPDSAQEDSHMVGAVDGSPAAECDSNCGMPDHQKACPRLKKKLMCGPWPKYGSVAQPGIVLVVVVGIE